MSTYAVTVTREDDFWIIRVPGLDGHRYADGSVNVGDVTQAMTEADVEREARDFIATVLDCEPSDFDVSITTA